MTGWPLEAPLGRPLRHAARHQRARVESVLSATPPPLRILPARQRAHRRHRGALWLAAGGAFWDLAANDLRTADWTSADAAGLPILPGLVRHEEATGVTGITHALRFTAPRTRSAYVWPARHEASSDGDPALPPMGVRFRLKASIDLSGVSPTNQAILTALKTYGMFLADNGSACFISGAPDPPSNADDLHQLGAIHGSDFEAVDESGLMVDPNSGQVQ